MSKCKLRKDGGVVERMTFKVGQTIWRGYRYWADLSFVQFDHASGWNTLFIPYRILAITSQRIKVQLLADSINGREATVLDKKPVYLNRAVLEKDDKQYHTRFHEYFYATKPLRDPEQHYRSAPAISSFNLPTPFTAHDVNREYKKLARTLHPDAGGTHEQFVELQRTRDEALRLAMP